MAGMLSGRIDLCGSGNRSLRQKGAFLPRRPAPGDIVTVGHSSLEGAILSKVPGGMIAHHALWLLLLLTLLSGCAAPISKARPAANAQKPTTLTIHDVTL